ncbi:MAG: hypothetical protein ACTSUT_15240 [Promethearchaeota archaeon]
MGWFKSLKKKLNRVRKKIKKIGRATGLNKVFKGAIRFIPGATVVDGLVSGIEKFIPQKKGGMNKFVAQAKMQLQSQRQDTRQDLKNRNVNNINVSMPEQNYNRNEKPFIKIKRNNNLGMYAAVGALGILALTNK